jgi:hypothetical protein
VAWQQETAPPPAFAEPFHPVNMARRAMLDQVHILVALLQLYFELRKSWPALLLWSLPRRAYVLC